MDKNKLYIDLWKDKHARLVFCYIILAFVSLVSFVFHLQQNQFDFISIIICLIFCIIVFSLIKVRRSRLTIYIYFKMIGYVMLPVFIVLTVNLWTVNLLAVNFLAVNIGKEIRENILLFIIVYMIYLLFISISLLFSISLVKTKTLKNSSFFQNKIQNNCCVKLSWLFILFPILYAIFVFLENIKCFSGLAILVYFLAVMVIGFLYISGQIFNVQLKASCVNLNNYEILNTNIYSLVRKTKNYQIFKLDFSQLFPENSYNQSIYVLNKYCFNHNRINEKKIDKRNYVYLSIDKHNQNQELEIKYCYTIKDKGKRKYVLKKCDLYLEIRCYGSLVYISQYQFKNFRKINSQKTINKHQCIEQYPLEYHALSAIKYCDTDGKLISIRAKEDSIYEYRKWLFHNGEFGIGKTTYDIYYAMEQGYQPVIVSPWEAHFDKDILQLIYLNMSNNHKEGLFAGISRKVFVFLAINMGALFLFFDNNIVKEICKIFYNRFIHTFYTFVSGYMENISFDWSASEIGYIIFMFASIFLSIYFLPSILLLKNGDTEKYQGFYIERIRSMYNNNPNIFLIIEDVDRLDPKVQEEVFRILSLLNSHIHQLKALGVISVDKTYIKIDKDGDPDKMLETIQNKIIYETIGEGYDYKKSIDLYLEEGVEFLYQYNHDLNYDCDLSLEDLKNEIQRKSDDNFRDVHKKMESLIKNINLGKYKKK